MPLTVISKYWSFCLILLVAFTSCNGLIKQKTSNSAVIQVLNGMGKMDTVRYTCDSCDKYIQSPDVLNNLLLQATKDAKASLNNPLSFIPRSIKLTIEPRDSFYYYVSNKHIDSCLMVNVEYECIGKNAYGTEGQVINSNIIFLVGNEIKNDFVETIRREPLKKLENGRTVDRLLTIYDDKEGKFSIQPSLSTPLSLIISSSISCIDKGALLTIIFEDKTEIRLRNWNDFNCKGIAYFNISDTDVESLKVKKVEYVSFYNDKQQFGRVSSNESDYFMQVVSLINK